MHAANLLDPDAFIRCGLFYFPRSEFRKRPKEASKQFFHFNETLAAFFTNTFLSNFLTDINRKNKRTHRVDPLGVTRVEFESIDELKCTGLCNQLIECFTIDYCDQYDIKAAHCIFPIKTEYNNNLQMYMTNCFAPFRRGPSIYYVDMEMALHDVFYEDQSPTDRANKAALYLRLGGDRAMLNSSVDLSLADGTTPRLAGLCTSTVGQLIFFRWFIGSGSMKKLLEHRDSVIAFLEAKRKLSLVRKRTRREQGTTHRERTIPHRETRCSAAHIGLRIEKKVKLE